jgi:hypothetical protein
MYLGRYALHSLHWGGYCLTTDGIRARFVWHHVGQPPGHACRVRVVEGVPLGLHPGRADLQDRRLHSGVRRGAALQATMAVGGVVRPLALFTLRQA